MRRHQHESGNTGLWSARSAIIGSSARTALVASEGAPIAHEFADGEIFRRNLMKDNARFVVYVGADADDALVESTVTCAHKCGAIAGFLAVERIDRLMNLTNGADDKSASL